MTLHPNTQTTALGPKVAFTCAHCGAQFFYRHACPSMPWKQTSTVGAA